MTTQSHHTFTRSPLRLIFCSLFLVAAVVAAIAAVASPGLAAKAGPAAPTTANAPGAPDVVGLVGPVVSNTKVRDLPYIPPAPQIPEERLTRYRHSGKLARSRSSGFSQFQSLLEKIVRPVPSMPLPLLTFDGIHFT